MNVKNYLIPTELSRDIKSFAETTEGLKVLYRMGTGPNQQGDPQAAAEYERQIGLQKFSIVSHLSNRSNYEQWKQSDNNNAVTLMKYIEKGHFDQEFSHLPELKDKIKADFKLSFDNASPESLMTMREKQTIKHFEANSVPVERRHNYENEDKLVAKIIDKGLHFEREFNHTYDNLPATKSFPKEVQKLLTIFKEDPSLLKDHPYHYVRNRSQNQYPTITTEQLLSLAMDASVGQKNALSSLQQVSKTIDSLQHKDSHREIIQQQRLNAYPNGMPENGIKIK